MLKLTRRSRNNKINKKNKTIKKGGSIEKDSTVGKESPLEKGSNPDTLVEKESIPGKEDTLIEVGSDTEKGGAVDDKNVNIKGKHCIEDPNYNMKKRNGIIDQIGENIVDITSTAATKAADIALDLAGLERKNQSDSEKNDGQKTNENPSGFISKAFNLADKTGAVIIDNINNVLESDAVKQTTLQAAKNTAKIVKETAQTFNDAINEPDIKTQIDEAILNAGKLGGVVIKASEEPVSNAVEVAAHSAQKATSAALTGAIKVGTDVMAATPYLGAIINVGKAINNASIAASAMSEAGSEVAEATADAVIQTRQNVNRLLKELDEKKKIGGQISNRTTNSIHEFENPFMSKTTGGGMKTRRRLLKRHGKSKRVRFAF